MTLLQILYTCPTLTLRELAYGCGVQYVFLADAIKFLSEYGPALYASELGTINEDFKYYMSEEEARSVIDKLQDLSGSPDRRCSLKWAFLLLWRIHSEWDNLTDPEGEVEDIVDRFRLRELNSINRAFAGAAGRVSAGIDGPEEQRYYKDILGEEVSALRREFCPAA